MSHHHEKPEKHEPGASAHGSQVAVIDGNRLLCPCCGEVLAILADEPPQEPPEEPPFENPMHRAEYGNDPLGRPQGATLSAIIRRQEAQEAITREPEEVPQETEEEYFTRVMDEAGPSYRADPLVVPIDPEIEAYEFPKEDPPEIPKPKKSQPAKLPPLEPRPKRERQLHHRYREREIHRSKQPIQEPLSYQEKRFFAWTYYRMKALNLQLQGEICAKQEEIDALERELNRPHETPSKEQPSTTPLTKHRLPCPRLRGHGKKVVQNRRRDRVRQALERASQTKERGPP
ncbi:hypothetical protein [Bremerella alba]|uniref:Uncharacterized protein n=1 Tax=Bremerella alba TaxID=980252 RepID=A0A7V9A6F4_9BACT|nr:hypothetical protein [Bremerella alba]MBA2114262.1 hypothetical protein [Bremerella alba]